MKNYKQLLSELPSKSVVVTFGYFNPPTTGHELIIKVVRKLAKQRKADHIVFVSSTQDKKNPLEVSKKIQYLETLFPNTRFVASKEDFLGSLKSYKNVVMVTSSDNVASYKKLLNNKFETSDVVPAGTKCPDSDDRVLKAASKGNYQSFKSGLPTTVRELDAKRLMNDIRSGLGLEPIKEQINLVKDDLREQYFRGEVFNEGEIVESNNTVYKIVKRGSNHLLLQDETGLKVSKWIQDVQLTEREFMLDKSLEESVSVTPGAAPDKAMQKAKVDTEKARLVAKQAEDKAKLVTMQKKEMDNLKTNLQKEDSPVVNKNSKYNIAKSIMSLSDFRKSKGQMNKDECEIADKVKDGLVGNVHMGDDHGLRHMKVKHHLGETKEASYGGDYQASVLAVKEKAAKKPVDMKSLAARMQASYAKDEKKPVKEETEEQQDTRKAQLKRFKQQAADAKLDPVTEAVYKGLEKEDKPGKIKTAVIKTHPKAVEVETVEGWKDEKKPVKEEFDDIDEEELIALVEADLDALNEDEFYEAYDDEELAIIDDETGEEIEAVAEEAEFDTEMIMEVLSRIERIRAKARMRRSQTKRARREKVALRQLSTPQVANKRARRMAISALKKRLLRGQNPQKISVGQKERVERYIAQRRKVVDRLATRMVTRVKQVEKARMAHKKFTKPNNGVSF